MVRACLSVYSLRVDGLGIPPTFADFKLRILDTVRDKRSRYSAQHWFRASPEDHWGIHKFSASRGDHCGFQKFIIWGNHSSTQYPDVNHATVATSSGEKNQRGAIIKARKLSSALSAASSACDHIRDWVLGTPKGKWVSMGVYSDGSYGIQPGLIYSFPVTCEKGEWSIVQGYAIVPMIAKGDMRGPGQPVILHMLDIEPVAEALKGVRMELINAAFPLLKDVVATTNAEEACKGVNIAAMVGGFPRKEGSGGCKSSKHQCTHLERICTFNPREKHYMSYPTRSQQALGQISERLNVHVVDVKNVIIWGNHSSTQYQDVNHATVTTSSGEKSVRDLVADDNWVEQLFARLNSEFITMVQ
ncbi:hypothetical protein FEM48_Zijuj08G0060200 [Ziziphus jujuba var. spinosa]|uniref:Lactate/malate dehydrogenase C-terminal domain-containing protein n=1 Tax=Ziziphus jujuba var. spinosa TaxID=714518 RepID=A0A978UXE0_ZIZJJ|nr:hypothetical protein FEM48_Zijuj08G0060200 [Ziziphus jujuba var. spinosa]